MHPVDAFLVDLDARWDGEGSPKVLLRILGSTALFLQTNYDRGTKDSDVLETQQLASVKDRLVALAGEGTALHERHRIYLDVVGSGIPILVGERGILDRST